MLAMSAATNNDRTSLCLFTSEVELFVPPGKGRSHTLRLLRELLNFEPRSRGTDLGGALSHLGRVLTRRGIVFLLSDFLIADGSDTFDRPLRMLSRRHEVIAVHISDPREQELPNVGLVRIRDPETGEARWLDTASHRVRDAYAATALQRDAKLERALARAKVDRIRLRTDEPAADSLLRYFHVKERRRR